MLNQYSDIKQLLEIELMYKTRCLDKNCNHTHVITNVNNCISVPIPKKRRPKTTLQTLIEDELSMLQHFVNIFRKRLYSDIHLTSAEILLD